MTYFFPTGQDALHRGWQDAKFSVAGLFTHDDVIKKCLTVSENFFSLRLPIESVHGAPPMLWNGGRPFVLYEGGSKGYGKLSVENIESSLTEYAERGIAAYCVCNNHLITEEHLDDPYCNDVLRCFSQFKNNGVIVSSSLLQRYIQDNYPLSCRVSAISAAKKHLRTADYYKEQTEYGRVVLHPDDNKNIDLLSQLASENFELMINEYCFYGCSNRLQHYELIAEAQLNPVRADEFIGSAAEALEKRMGSCEALPLARQAGKYKRNLVMTFEDISNCYLLGFRHFKIQGRKLTPHHLAFDVLRFMLEPKVAFPLAYAALCELLD